MPLSQKINDAGFALVRQVLTDTECDRLAAEVRRSASVSGGTRSLLENAWCQLLAVRLREHALLAPLLQPNYVAVQCTYFEKSASRNWLVPVHQDLSIPVAEHIEHPSLRGWSEKEGALFVQAPDSVLEQLLALRVHLDDCSENDGPLRVVPGTHALGTLEAQAAVAARRSKPEFVCAAPRGSVLAMRPLLLHSSSKATGAGLRRVLHFLFGPKDLPLGLRWQDAVALRNQPN